MLGVSHLFQNDDESSGRTIFGNETSHVSYISSDPSINGPQSSQEGLYLSTIES